MKLTLIDDSPQTHRLLQESIQGQSGVLLQSITSAPYFDSAIERSINEFNPDLIILDLRIGGPSEEGFRVLRQLKESSLLGSTPVVVCSTEVIPKDPNGRTTVRALHFGAEAALPKMPFPDLQEFIQFARKANGGSGKD